MYKTCAHENMKQWNHDLYFVRAMTFSWQNYNAIVKRITEIIALSFRPKSYFNLDMIKNNDIRRMLTILVNEKLFEISSFGGVGSQWGFCFLLRWWLLVVMLCCWRSDEPLIVNDMEETSKKEKLKLLFPKLQRWMFRASSNVCTKQ